MPKAEFDVVPPYDFNLSTRFCERTKFETLDRNDQYCLKRLVEIDNIPVLMEIGCRGSVNNPAGLIRWSCPGGGTVEKQKVLEVGRKVTSADVDLLPFYDILIKSPRLNGLHKKLFGLKPILTPTAFESAAWAIIGQQVNLTFATKIKIRLEKKYGQQIKIKNRLYSLFPNPRKIARARVDTLRKMQFSQRKAEYLIGLSKTIINDGDFFESLDAMAYEDAVNKLIDIRGIGIWSANYLLMRGVGHLNCLPLGDTGLASTVLKNYNLKKKPDKDKIEKLAREFEPYRSLYTLYLWYSLI